MGAFEYTAMDKAGKQVKGLLEGDTPKHVRQLLRDRKLLPVSVPVTNVIAAPHGMAYAEQHPPLAN